MLAADGDIDASTARQAAHHYQLNNAVAKQPETPT